MDKIKVLQNEERLLLAGLMHTSTHAKAEEFMDFVSVKKQISINLNLESLAKVLKSGQYLNIFELGYGLDEIRRRYDSSRFSLYFDKLMQFVELFDQEKSIKYGSLNVGGLGSNYPGFGNGQICLVLKNSFIDTLIEKLICIKTFSLNYFEKINDKFEFNFDKFYNDVSFWNFVEYLSLEKHLIDLNTIDKENWPYMISNKRGWLETLIYSSIFIDDIEEIRMESNLLTYGENILQTEPMNNYDKITQAIWNDIFDTTGALNLKIVAI